MIVPGVVPGLDAVVRPVTKKRSVLGGLHHEYRVEEAAA